MNSSSILIVDEQSFGKICTALVEMNGFSTEWASGSEDDFHLRDFDRYRMVITSYPYGKILLEQLEGKQVALLVLSDYAFPLPDRHSFSAIPREFRKPACRELSQVSMWS